MLCSACQSIFRGPLIFDAEGQSDRKDHHVTAQSLAQAIRQNCYICNSAFQHKADTFSPQGFEEGLDGTKYRFSTEDGTPYPTLWLYGPEPDWYRYVHRYD